MGENKMSILDDKEIINLARRELEEELTRGKINAMKEKLRSKKTFWQKLFPFKITIERR
jgi:AMMECR1 domain-containing protein